MNVFSLSNIIKWYAKLQKDILSPSSLSLLGSIVIFLLQAPLMSYNPISRYYMRNWSCRVFNGSLGGVRTGKVPKLKENTDKTAKIFYSQIQVTLQSLDYFFQNMPTFSIFHTHYPRWSSHRHYLERKRTPLKCSYIFFYYFIHFSVNILAWYFNFCFEMSFIRVQVAWHILIHSLTVSTWKR